MNYFVRIAALIMAGGIFSACAAQGVTQLNQPTHLSVEKIAHGQHCDINDKMSVTWINNPQQLTALLQQIHRYIINAKTPVPEVDFSQSGVVVVSMGTQRSGGYALELSNSPLSVNGDTATLKLKWRRPGKGMITTQMLTSPCLVLKISQQNYKYLRVVTLTGKTIGTVNIPK